MTPHDPHATDADLFGLPQAADSASAASRDPVESLATEYLDDLRTGQRRPIDYYVARAPQAAAQIRELFPLIAALEDWKSDREISTARETLPERFDIERLGDCRILRELGRGGMGVVFEAEQAPIGRRVAVKLLPFRFSSGSRWRERFQSEARTAAQLQHPHIVPVYSYGEHEGRAYYVMQLVEGVGLNRVLDRLRAGAEFVGSQDVLDDFHAGRTPEPASQPPRPIRVLRRHGWPQITRLVYQVADALRYAHAQGTLHRDIKPANLLIDARGSIAVADFGLALVLSEENPGAPSRIAGTLRYMAPEQFEGHSDQRTDLYALGVSLYELCTLRPAFAAADKGDLVRQICEAGPPPPRKVDPEIPRRLEAIILRATERNPSRRYQSAEELIGDLKTFLRAGRWPFLFRWRR
jgi:serine/threonine protein kinase